MFDCKFELKVIQKSKQTRQQNREDCNIEIFFAGDAVTDLGTITQRPVQKNKNEI
jgi:hypothetical protein